MYVYVYECSGERKGVRNLLFRFTRFPFIDQTGSFDFSQSRVSKTGFTDYMLRLQAMLYCDSRRQGFVFSLY